MTTNDDLSNRFQYHAPTPEQPEVYELIRDTGLLLALLIRAASKSSREQSLAITRVEEAVMQVNAAVARHGLSDPAHGGAADLLLLTLTEHTSIRPDSQWHRTVTADPLTVLDPTPVPDGCVPADGRTIPMTPELRHRHGVPDPWPSTFPTRVLLTWPCNDPRDHPAHEHHPPEFGLRWCMGPPPAGTEQWKGCGRGACTVTHAHVHVQTVLA